MGKIKTKLTKRVSANLIKTNPNLFKTNFEDNKKLLPQTAEIRSKRLRNIIAGYIARLVKKEQEI